MTNKRTGANAASLRRAASLTALVCTCLATTCRPAVKSLAVTPAPEMGLASATDSAFTIVARVVARSALLPSAGDKNCFEGNALPTVCGKAYGGQIGFIVTEPGRVRSSPRARSLQRELIDSLSVYFGRSRVRGCAPALYYCEVIAVDARE